MAEVLLDGVSPETLRDVHQDEVRLRRSAAMSAAVVSVLAGGAWLALELTQPRGAGGPCAGTIPSTPRPKRKLHALARSRLRQNRRLVLPRIRRTPPV